MIKKGAFVFFYYWLPVFFYCLIIFIQSSYPTPKGLPELPFIDKLYHFAGYTLLGMLLMRGFKNSRFGNNYKVIMTLSVLLTGLYGASDELYQHYVPYRTGDIWDFIFDSFGGVFGVYIYQILSEKYPKIRHI